MDLIGPLPAFLLAVLLISASPGPATALILRRVALRGTRAAVPTVLGLEAGLYALVRVDRRDPRCIIVNVDPDSGVASRLAAETDRATAPGMRRRLRHHRAAWPGLAWPGLVRVDDPVRIAPP